VPAMIRWPEKIAAGKVSNGIMSMQDWVPTLMAAVGEPDIKEKLKTGAQVGNMKYKVHLDGYNFLPYLTGEEENGPPKEFIYFNDDGQLVATRFQQ